MKEQFSGNRGICRMIIFQKANKKIGINKGHIFFLAKYSFLAASIISSISMLALDGRDSRCHHQLVTTLGDGHFLALFEA
ncbi:MAG: hypothetical protein UW41_C0031G0008 [Candidatus Collierbacteria bacterium GW2011_GWC2_44_18]|uniref:Uncharacterized protein n=1 Tax=Candidatus Collierbacteria bacterium GW2011_GWC2_44_18 TaxID=1618392 RepID=A0A0G1HMF0_9BACT|nr:MAG: hypothetical protein UW41_C0031G0008 [Candidatus Collierbacteria bacterium GW2011_GWC2_44_18]